MLLLNMPRSQAMPTPEQIRATVQTYIQMMCISDIDGIMALYAEDATAEDPVGGETKQGIAALREFYAFAAPQLHVELKGPICVSGNSCAFLLLAKHTMEDVVVYLDATDVFTFNTEGKITSMKAYWNPAELRPER
jgi:steroid delta-isomerase